MSGQLTLTATTISWASNQAGSAPNVFTLNLGHGVFSAIPGGSQESVQNLDFATEPVGTTFGPVPFISFPTYPALPGLDLNFLYSGWAGSADCAAAPAIGQMCTPSGSALSFINYPGDTSAVYMSLSGISADHAATWTGNFSFQFSTPYQTVLSTLASGGSVTTSYSASDLVLTSVPEPASLALVVSGILMVAGGARQRLRR